MDVLKILGRRVYTDGSAEISKVFDANPKYPLKFFLQQYAFPINQKSSWNESGTFLPYFDMRQN